MKILICGTEEFDDWKYLEETCLNIISKEQYVREISNKELEFISGHAPKGGDYLGEKFANKYKCSLKLFPADWNEMNPKTPDNWGNRNATVIVGHNFYGEYNRLSGLLRNQEMANQLTPDDIVIAFRIKKSSGTSDMIKRAKKTGAKVFQIDYDQEKKVKVWNE